IAGDHVSQGMQYIIKLLFKGYEIFIVTIFYIVKLKVYTPEMIFGKLGHHTINEGGTQIFIFYDAINILAVKPSVLCIIVDIIIYGYKDRLFVLFIDINKPCIYFGSNRISIRRNSKPFADNHIQPGYIINQRSIGLWFP